MLFHAAGQPDGVGGREAFMYVVQEFDVEAEFLAQSGEHRGHGAGVRGGVEVGPGERAVGCGRQRRLSAAVPAELAAHVPDALREPGADVVGDFGGVAAVGVPVDGGGLAHLAAEQLVERQSGDLSLDVPQGHVDAGDRVVELGSVAPVAADGHRLPEVFDPVGLLAAQERVEVVGDDGAHRVRALREGGAADAVQAGLRGFDFHHDQPVDAVGHGEDRTHGPDRECGTVLSHAFSSCSAVREEAQE